MASTSTPPAPAAGNPLHGSTDPATLALVDELKKLVADLLKQRVNRMFDGADDMLFEMAGRAKNNDEQRVYFDTMRVVRLNKPAIARVFQKEIVAGFEPGSQIEKPVESREISFDELGLAESKSVEETIAVANMVTKAEGLYQKQLWELGRRLDWLIRERQAPIARHALSPTLFCNAFRRGAESLDVDFPVELAIYKLFDRQVINELPELYASVLRFFDSHGVQAVAVGTGPVRVSAMPAAASGGAARPLPPAATPPPPPARISMPPAAPLQMPVQMPPQPMAWMPAASATPSMVPATTVGMPQAGTVFSPPPPPQPSAALHGFTADPRMMPHAPPGSAFAQIVDMQTMHALHAVQAVPPMPGQGYSEDHGEGYSDGDLAGDLQHAAQGGMVAGWSLPQAFSYVQRTGLVGRMFNDILSDPNLPQALKPQFDQLRFSVIKSALKDSSFFANPAHPVRGLVNDLATMAATARTTGLESLKKIEDLVSKIQGQFDEAAHTVTAQPEQAEPMQDQEIEHFLDQQLVQSKTRRRSIIEKARRVVSEELQLRMVGLSIPESAKPLLQSGWAPMMALILLRHGMDSDAWREGILTFRRIVNALDPKSRAARTPLERDELIADIEDDLHTAGMQAPKIRELLAGFREALESLERSSRHRPHAPAAATEDAAVEAVDAAAEPPAPAREPEAALPEVALTPLPPDPIPDEPGALLDLLLVPGSWFHVHDHERGEARWLKVVAHYQEHDRPAYRDSVAFAEFNGRNTVLVKTEVLLDDLVSRRSEPFDQSPSIRKALQRLVSRRDADTAVAA